MNYRNQKKFITAFPIVGAVLFAGCIAEEELVTPSPAIPSTGESFTLVVDIDENNDGVTDDTVTLELDQYGVPMTSSLFFSEGITNTEMDDYGNVKSIEQLDNRDYDPGTGDDRYVLEFDQGKVIRQSFDEFNDGIDVGVYEMSYNNDGSIRSIKFDDNGNGNFEQVVFFKKEKNYSNQGYLSMIGIEGYDFDDWLYESSQDDHNDDGVIDETRTFIYDENNVILRLENDLNGDGVSDLTNNYSYSRDTSDNILTKSYDDISNGFGVDRIWTYTYDENNNRTSELEQTGDGLFIRKYMWAYDSMNRKISESYYSSDNMNVDKEETWTYNNEGQLVQKTKLDNWYSSDYRLLDVEYDVKGNITKVSKDYDGDTAVYESIVLIEYDDNNRPVKFSYDGDSSSAVNGSLPTGNRADGTIDNSYTYNMSGNLYVYDHYFVEMDMETLLDL